MDGWDWVVGWGGDGVGVGWRLRVGGPCNSVRRVPITACKLRGLESLLGKGRRYREAG